MVGALLHVAVVGVGTSSATTSGLPSWSSATDLSGSPSAIARPELAMSASGQYITSIWKSSNVVQTRTSNDYGATWGAVAGFGAIVPNKNAPSVMAIAEITEMKRRDDAFCEAMGKSYVQAAGRAKHSMQALCNIPNVCKKPKSAGCAAFEMLLEELLFFRTESGARSLLDAAHPGRSQEVS